MGNIIKFAVPLLLGNLFQQLYNMVDTWVIGQTGENGAYAAVGSVGPVINILIGFFLGFSSGAGVVISQYYGAGNHEKVRKAVHTSVTVTFAFCILFTVLGVLMTPFMLNIMLHSTSSTDSVYPFAKDYLTIYFSGISGLLIYNLNSGILRAVGDSRNPFIFLVVSAVINTALDLLFVFKFGMGVRGVALATVIAQGISALLTLITLVRSDSCIKLSFKKLGVDLRLLRDIFSVGIPAALQMALTAFSNVFVQSYIAGVNGVKEFCLGGWTTYSKIDQIIFLPLQSLALSVSTFVGQNLGKGDEQRAKKGTRQTYFVATSVTVLLIIVVEIFAPRLAGLFNPDPDVVYYSEILLRRITPFYLCCCVNQIFSASLRGAGDSKAPMFIMLGSFVVFRQIYLYIMSNYISNDLVPIGLSYPAGWFVCACTMLIYFKINGFRKNTLSSSVRSEK